MMTGGVASIAADCACYHLDTDENRCTNNPLYGFDAYLARRQLYPKKPVINTSWFSFFSPTILLIPSTHPANFDVTRLHQS